MRRYAPLLTILSAVLLLVAACARQGSASDVIEKYLQAKVKSDADRLASLSCKEWEAQAAQDATSFESVKAELQDMSCKAGDKDGPYTLVTCEGKIVVAYQGETREFPLSATTYRAVLEDGEWKMCGEQK